MFCITGIAVGTIIGYYMGINTKPPCDGHMNVKAIVCYRYDGLEVCHVQCIPVKFLAHINITYTYVVIAERVCHGGL